MRDIINDYGHNAGKIWNTLFSYGSLDEEKLIKKSQLNKNEFYIGVGWLARENKISKQGLIYELNETNLTDKIGVNAGKVWNTLKSSNNETITSIAKISKISLKDAYYAIGWLARENKVEPITQNLKNQVIKFQIK